MDARLNDSGLLLPDLHIENFRGIKKLSIPRLGRVTLLAGRNSVGKTTVLDAVRVYSTRGLYTALAITLETREEILAVVDSNFKEEIVPDWSALFYGRNISHDICVSIGPKDDKYQLRLEVVSPSPEQTSFVQNHAIDPVIPGQFRILRVGYQGKGYAVPWILPFDGGAPIEVRTALKISPTGKSEGVGRISDDKPLPPPINCFGIGPGILDYFAISNHWKKVALTDDEREVMRSLTLVYGNDLERVSVVSDGTPSRQGVGQRAIVKLKGNPRPVPLRSLGDGAMRLFGVALALANSRNGFLLIDEAENGIHHSVQQDFWRMVLQTAHENNVQVFATTHSWDCVRGFAQAAVENENVEGVLVRLEKEDDGLRAVRYSERRLKIAAEQRIEVR